MRPSGRMFCFTAPPRAPAGACSAPPPARPGAPGEQRSESFPPTQRPSGTLPARAKCGTLSSQRPRTPPAPGQILREHPTCVPRPSPVRNTSPTYPSGAARQAALRDVAPKPSSLLAAALLHHAPRPRRQGRDTLHRISPAHPMQARGPTIPTRATQSAQSSPSPHNAACTPASAHRSTARKSPVLPAGRTGREASEASTAARSAADSLKWLSP